MKRKRAREGEKETAWNEGLEVEKEESLRRDEMVASLGIDFHIPVVIW